MRPDDLRQFISLLEERGELARIQVPVNPELEAAAIIDRASKGEDGGMALLFSSVTGTSLPLVANLFSSSNRIALALGVDTIEQLSSRLHRDLAASGRDTSADALLQLTGAPDWQAVEEDRPTCFSQDLSAQGLRALPALRAWPRDGGRYLTLGQVFTRHPDTAAANCGMYRLQIVDRQTALLRCHPGSGGGAHLHAWHARGAAAPVSVVLGGPPLLTWVAGMSLPENIDEVAFAGYLSRRPLVMARCRSNDLRVPAAAEIVIEGHVHPGETELEGPFGNHTGRYAPASPAPVLRVERVWARPDAICPATLVGPSPRESAQLALAAKQLLLPLLQLDSPWVKEVHLPIEGIHHRAALVAVAGCEIPLEEISRQLWQSALLRNSRLLILLDQENHVHACSQAYWRMINAAPWEESVLIDAGRMVIDARSPTQGAEVSPDEATVQRVTERWAEFGLK